MSQFQAKQFSEEQIASAPDLEPALEGLLRNAEVDEGVITAFKVQRIHTRALFVALDSTEECVRSTAKEAFGVDVESGGFIHKREMAKIITAWTQGKVMTETKVKIDALLLPEDWDELLKAFKKKYGRSLPDNKLPGQSYFEAFMEKLQEGRLKPESLSKVVTAEEEEKFEQKRPESSQAVRHSPRQYSERAIEKEIHVQYAAQCRRAQSKMHGDEAFVALGTDATAGTTRFLRLGQRHLDRSPGGAAQ